MTWKAPSAEVTSITRHGNQPRDCASGELQTPWSAANPEGVRTTAQGGRVGRIKIRETEELTNDRKDPAR